MAIVVVGLNHTTAPVAVRERLAFSDTTLAAALVRFQPPEVTELVILSTCNRVELYVQTDDVDASTASGVAFLAACHLELDAAVDCYGGFIVEDLPDAVAVQMRPIIDHAPSLRCPLLGLFGAEDLHPSPSETTKIAEVLADHAKTFEFHTFEAAGHAFFAADRPTYRVAAAKEGWEQVLRWFERHLAS